MKLTIEINLDNAAFDGNNTAEVIRILGQLRIDMIGGLDLMPAVLYDFNGNKCGTARVTRTRPNKRSKTK